MKPAVVILLDFRDGAYTRKKQQDPTSHANFTANPICVSSTTEQAALRLMGDAGHAIGGCPFQLCRPRTPKWWDCAISSVITVFGMPDDGKCSLMLGNACVALVDCKLFDECHL